jgi:sortase A
MDPDELIPPEFKKDNIDGTRDAAANVIRTKLDSLYAQEPDAQSEAEEVSEISSSHLSKHQKFMKKLTASDKSTAEVQTAWHEYYQSLSESEKHEVWQEFYSEQAKKRQEEKAQETRIQAKEDDELKPLPRSKPAHRPSHSKTHLTASSAHLQKLRKNHHVKSLLFGLSMGLTVVFILLFSFFNERFIVPFIRPNQNVSATPIIIDPNSSGMAGPEPKIIIPKINVEAPVVYDVKTIEEKDVQAGLERGVVHYATTPNPGQVGNSVIFGHSSSNILNKGKYKFAFILLRSLDTGDTFIIQKDSKRYVYKVYNKFITSPTDFSVLQPSDRGSTMTLITCDPPGTSTNRLIVQAEQIFPDPRTNTKSSAPQVKLGQPEQLPSNSISLWQRIVNAF